MEGKKPKGRPRRLMLDWALADNFIKLKERPKNERSGDIQHLNTFALGGLAENQKKESDGSNNFSYRNISSL